MLRVGDQVLRRAFGIREVVVAICGASAQVAWATGEKSWIAIAYLQKSDRSK